MFRTSFQNSLISHQARSQANLSLLRGPQSLKQSQIKNLSRDFSRLQNVSRSTGQVCSRLHQSTGLFTRMAPKRMFNDNIDRTLRRALDKLPEGNIGYAIVGLNTLFYGLYLLWPKGNMFAFYNNFTFSHFGLRQGCLHNMFTCHFAQMSLFHWALDSVIAFMFCRNLSQMFGNLFVAKTVLLSMFLGTFFVFMKEAALGVVPPFNGNDAILRGLIFSLIISNPQAQLMLFPLPINIPAWAIAALLLTMDFFTFNSAAFGGVSASYLMVNFFM